MARLARLVDSLRPAGMDREDWDHRLAIAGCVAMAAAWLAGAIYTWNWLPDVARVWLIVAGAGLLAVALAYLVLYWVVRIIATAWKHGTRSMAVLLLALPFALACDHAMAEPTNNLVGRWKYNGMASDVSQGVWPNYTSCQTMGVLTISRASSEDFSGSFDGWQQCVTADTDPTPEYLDILSHPYTAAVSGTFRGDSIFFALGTTVSHRGTTAGTLMSGRLTWTIGGRAVPSSWSAGNCADPQLGDCPL